MVEEETLAGVEAGDLLHVILAQLEIEDVEILLHALHMYGLRYDDHTALDEPAQSYLSRRFAIFLSDTHKDRVGEEIVAALGKRPPRHDVAAILLHILPGADLLVEHVGLHLIHHRRNLHVACEVNQMVRVEIADTDGT